MQLLDVGIVFIGLFHNVGHVKDDIGISDGGVHEGQHIFLKPVIGLEDAGGVRVHYLEVLAAYDTHYAVPRGLGLGGDD